MKSSLLAALLMLFQQWQVALPGYHYEFPRDHFIHPAYQTEWWYYTGNLRAPNGHRFGFELTFFRSGIHLPDSPNPVWRSDELYLAHLALSDLDGGEYYHTERLNRAGPGLAGASMQQKRVWNGNWQVRWDHPDATTPSRFQPVYVASEPPPGKAAHHQRSKRHQSKGSSTRRGLALHLVYALTGKRNARPEWDTT